MTEEITMARGKNKIPSVLKKLGYTIIGENRHIKCRDKDGNIRIVSRKYLDRCANNPRFFNTVTSNRGLWLKNKTPEAMSNLKKDGII